MNNGFWRGKRVFITGHTGFKGGWLSLWLQKLGAEVTGYSLPAPTSPSLFESARVADGMNSLLHDVRDIDSLRAALARQAPQVVFHLAAQPLVRFSYANPRETYETNVMGTVNLLEAVRQTDGVRAVVIVTSDKCYENREWIGSYRETDPMGGHDPYSSSKGCVELVAAAFRNSFFSSDKNGKHVTALATARAGNVIGGGDWGKDRLVPDAVRAFAAGRPAVIRRPDAVRPWQHVLEPLSGYLLLAERLYAGDTIFAEGWNFGPDITEALPVGKIIERLSKLWGGQATWLLDKRDHPYEAICLKLDSSKARGRLGWRPRWSLDRALEATVEWYKTFHAGRLDGRTLVHRQIESYSREL